ncbi:MAG: phosphoribosylamine--glycine ligase [Chloroflexi bacterium]|nr:phosphoribosylamine--glycine ligase [Chloroflexota bacterium]
MKFLVVGNGARDHAIAWKLSQSSVVTELLVAPGNAGTEQIGRNVPIGAEEIDGLLRSVQDAEVDVTVVGPEAPLAAGIADRFREAGLRLFGPGSDAARIESSKSFAKDLMVKHGVPTSAAEVFDDHAAASDYVRQAPEPLVVKADGLAAGKGVVVAQTRGEALAAVRRIMVDREFGAAGDRILIEECLEGQEVSVFAFVDGDYVSPMVAACDYKRVGDGDVGPNTGGMGSFSPPDFWDTELEEQVRREIMEPVAGALVKMGSPYLGVLYAGLMVTAEGPKVIEFNCRMGDPETQAVLPRLRADLGEVIVSAVDGELDRTPIEWAPSACVSVVVASAGYPGRYTTGHPIEGLEALDDEVMAFHAGTKTARGNGPSAIVTNGGRVLTLSALGKTLDEARQKVYANIGRVRFRGSFYRGDIAAAFTSSPASGGGQ